MFCDVPVGKDTTGNFTLSYKGVAVRTDCNRFIAFRKEEGRVRLYDVTGLTLPGCDALIYRVPVTERDVVPDDLLLISDCPLQVLYVTEVNGDWVTGVTSTGEQITYTAPTRLGDCARFIRIYSVLDACGVEASEMDENQIAIIAALLCCKPCGGAGYAAEILSSTVATDVLGQEEHKHLRQVPLLLALQQGQCLESFILTQAMQRKIRDPRKYREAPAKAVGPPPPPRKRE
jgi:hypothetical protein